MNKIREKIYIHNFGYGGIFIQYGIIAQLIPFFPILILIWNELMLFDFERENSYPSNGKRGQNSS
jgi:hypothetical protein